MASIPPIKLEVGTNPSFSARTHTLKLDPCQVGTNPPQCTSQTLRPAAYVGEVFFFFFCWLHSLEKVKHASYAQAQAHAHALTHTIGLGHASLQMNF